MSQQTKPKKKEAETQLKTRTTVKPRKSGCHGTNPNTKLKETNLNQKNFSLIVDAKNRKRFGYLVLVSYIKKPYVEEK